MNDDKRRAEDKAVQNTLLNDYCPPLIAEARKRQDELLDRLIGGGGHRIADIGCGDGYHGVMFADRCTRYDGFEIAPDIAAIARKKLAHAGVQHATIIEGDATGYPLEPNAYDLAFCLYFTPGNFRTSLEDLSGYTDDYLDHNPGFIGMVRKFMDALEPGGRMFLCVYRDVPEAEASQLDFYEKTGQHVITPRGSRFVATAENFWSARWTRESMLSNLRDAGVRDEDVTFHDLNAIAWLVEITKAAG